MGSAETAKMRTLIIFLLFSFLIAVIGASSSNSSKAGTTKRLLTITDNQNILEINVFKTLFEYALDCCQTYYPDKNCKDNTRVQMAYFAFIPKSQGTSWADIKTYLEAYFNPSKIPANLKAATCGKDSTKPEYRRFAIITAGSEHTERTLLTKIKAYGEAVSPDTDAQNFYLFTVKSPCTTSTEVVTKPSCTDAIFYTEYSILQKWKSSKFFHSLHVGFREWFVWEVNGVYVEDAVGRDHFCLGHDNGKYDHGLGVDGNKWDRGIVSNQYDYKSKLSFWKIRLQNGDATFNPGTTSDGKEHC